jgi:F0F1-type ATP synthase gamma subunit
VPALVDIRRRIKSVKNTQQITKAMSFSAAEALLCRRVRAARAGAAEMTLRPERGRI